MSADRCLTRKSMVLESRSSPLNSPETKTSCTKGEVLKSNSLLADTCVFCKDTQNLKSMKNDYLYQGNVENYTTILKYCFDLKLVIPDTCEICDTCIGRLRDVFNFRKLVESINELFQKEEKRDSIDEIDSAKKKFEIPLNHKLKLENGTNDVIVKKEMDVNNHNDYLSLNDFDMLRDQDSFNLDDDIKTEPVFNAGDCDWRICKDEAPQLLPSALDCPVCQETFSRHRLLRLHYLTHFPKFICNTCGKAHLNKHGLIRHLTTHASEKHICQNCGKIYSYIDTLNHHILKCHRDLDFSRPLNTDTMSKHQCKTCGKTFAYHSNLCNHILKYHKEEKSPSIPNQRPMYKCKFCNEKFKNDDRRHEHQSEVHAAPMRCFVCPTCGLVFKVNSRLTRHIRRTHMGIKNHSCKMCDKKFFSRAQLKNHMISHTGEKNFPCEQCNKSFGRKTNLLQHLESHSGVRKHKCTLCKKDFVYKCGLKTHMKAHESASFK